MIEDSVTSKEFVLELCFLFVLLNLTVSSFAEHTQEKKENKYLPRTQLVKISAERGHRADSKYSALLG